MHFGYVKILIFKLRSDFRKDQNSKSQKIKQRFVISRFRSIIGAGDKYPKLPDTKRNDFDLRSHFAASPDHRPLASHVLYTFPDVNLLPGLHE